MSKHHDLEELERCLDEGRRPPDELLGRLEADPHLHRRARALRKLDAGLREELAALAVAPTPSVARHVLQELRPRAPSGAPTWLRHVALVATAAAAVWLLRPVHEATPAPAASPLAAVASPARWLSWPAAVAPLTSETTPIESPLLEEGRRLADDTRHVARSLWSRMPVVGLLLRLEEPNR